MMNIEQITRLDWDDINRLDRKTLAKQVSALGSAINKRVRRMDAKNVDSPALQSLKKSGGNISVAGKDVNQLRAEFLRAKQFLESKTSSFAGIKKVQKAFEKRIGGSLSPAETKDFWKAYNKIAEANPAGLKQYGSQQAQQMLREEMVNNPGLNSDNYSVAVLGHMREVYETMEAEEAEQAAAYESSSDFFDIESDF